MAISTTKGKFRKTGDTLDYTATSDVSAGDILIVDGLACLARWDIANGATGVLKVLKRGEVVELTTDDAIGATDANTAIYLDGNAASHYRPLRDTFRTQLALWGSLFRRNYST